MVMSSEKKVKILVVDTTAFIQNAPLQDVAEKLVTCEDVVNEITSKRQLRRLCVLPYDLQVKNVDPESVRVVTEFAKKTGDYASLSATDIKVIALTYQLEKELEGVEHLRDAPVMTRTVNLITGTKKGEHLDMSADVTGFYLPGKKRTTSSCTEENNESGGEIVDVCKESKGEIINESEKGDENSLEDKNKSIEKEDISQETEEVDNSENENKEIHESDKSDSVEIDELKVKFETLDCKVEDLDEPNKDILMSVEEDEDYSSCESDEEEDDDEDSWITPSNVQKAKKQINSDTMEEKNVSVACMTTDFAMQNVLKQMNLNVSALDGRMIKQLRTYILRCYTCFGTTSLMEKKFCPKCGNNTLKKVAVSLDEEGKQQIHINTRKPLTGRGKRFSLPTMKGGKHSNNPRVVEDQPMPGQRLSRLAIKKINPLDDDYIAGYSPFATRDVTSRSAQLCLRPGTEVKHWMKKNPNEARRHKKK